MSNYTNLIDDFASRCLDVLNPDRPGSGRSRSVTKLIMIASAAIIIPYERLQDRHPSQDRCEFPRLAELVNDKQTAFIETLFCKEAGNWKYGSHIDTRNPLEWVDAVESNQLDEKHKIACVLNIIRNALAHGSLHFHGDPIQDMIFMSKIMDHKTHLGYEFIQVTTSEFKVFVTRWLEYLEDQQPESSQSRNSRQINRNRR